MTIKKAVSEQTARRKGVIKRCLVFLKLIITQ